MLKTRWKEMPKAAVYGSCNASDNVVGQRITAVPEKMKTSTDTHITVRRS